MEYNRQGARKDRSDDRHFYGLLLLSVFTLDFSFVFVLVSFLDHDEPRAALHFALQG